MNKLVQTLWGSLVSCSRLSIGPPPRLQPAGGGNQPPRRLSTCPTLMAFLVLLVLPLSVIAQQQQLPHAGYVYPAGGRQGTTFEITVGGQFLDGVKSASVSGAGVQATVVDHFKPLTPAQATQLRDQAKELSEKPS